MGAWTYSIIMLTFSLSCLSLVLLKIRTVVDCDFDKTIITWQGWQDVNRTFEGDVEINVEEIRQLLDEDHCPDGEILS